MEDRDLHVFQGLSQDSHPSVQDPKLLIKAKNIRLTARNENTLAAITNELGTKKIENVLIRGTYLGHCILNNKVVVFTTMQNREQSLNPDIITIITKVNEDEYSVDGIKGNWDFDVEHPIECLGFYENENIQKVYWIDGKNQPRMINIAGDLSGGTDGYYPIDFVAELTLQEKVEVTQSFTGNGRFPAGVVQYAFTYYNLYGRQSNIWYTTPLYYVTFPTRAGSPEEKVTNSFTINVSNLDEHFDYLRIYQILRTSIDAEAQVKSIVDIEIKACDKDINDKPYTIFTDNNLTGSNVDPSELLFIGGEQIIPKAFCQKDNTLFFGNYSIIRHPVDKTDVVSASLQSSLRTIDNSVDLPIAPELSMKGSYYQYTNTTQYAGFKPGEQYRIGIQFQHISGKWSDPVFLEDFVTDKDTHFYWGYDGNGTNNDTIIHVPDILATVELNIESLNTKGYKRARLVGVYPTMNERLILTQGVLCPTVYSLKDRSNNTPFAQSSWFFRPNYIHIEDGRIIDDYDDHKYDSVDLIKGSVVEFRHGYLLGDTSTLRGEIYGVRQSGLPNASLVASTIDNRVFAVDQSIVTMHSPEIEFDSQFAYLTDSNWKLNIIGAVELASNIGDINIQTSTNKMGVGAAGFAQNPIGVPCGNTETGRILNTTGSWEDSLVLFEDEKYKEGPVVTFPVFPWHKSGSLNNDTHRLESQGQQTAILKTKKISNLRSSVWTKRISSSQNYVKYDVTKPQLFNSEEISVLKIPYVSDRDSEYNYINYYGNVDTLLTGTATPLICETINDKTHLVIPTGTEHLSLTVQEASIRMKYKSTPHLVFALTATTIEGVEKTLANGCQIALPSYEGSYWAGTSTAAPWLLEDTKESVTFIKFFTTHNTGDKDDLLDYLINQQEDIQPGDLFTGPFGSDNIYALCQCIIDVSSGNRKAIYVDTRNRKYKAIGPAGTGYAGEMCYFQHKEGNYTNAVLDLYLEVPIPTIPEQELAQPRILLPRIQTIQYPYLWLGELYRNQEDVVNAFGGTTEEALQSNIWIPIGEPVDLSEAVDDTLNLTAIYGDTWYQKYDCLKTYPFTLEDENSIVEIGSFMLETRVNIDGRYDKRRGQISNYNMLPTIFNQINEVYNQQNNFFNYNILPDDYYKLNNYTNQITWSKVKTPTAKVDLWTNVTLAGTYDVDGAKDEIVCLITFNDKIIVFQKKGVSQLLYNERVQINPSDNIPIEIANSAKVQAHRYYSDTIGCNNKWSVCKTPSGVYFINSNNKELYKIDGDTISNISAGMSTWYKQFSNESWKPIDPKGFKVHYDSNYNDIYVSSYINGYNSNANVLNFSEVVNNYISCFPNYSSCQALFNIDTSFYAFRNREIDGNNFLEMHKLFATKDNTIFDEPFSWEIGFISNNNPTIDKIFTNLEFRGRYWEIVDEEETGIHYSFFNKMSVMNDYQNMSQTLIRKDVNFSNVRRKFNVWHVLFPRIGATQRLRSPWAEVTLTQEPDSQKTVAMELENNIVVHSQI